MKLSAVKFDVRFLYTNTRVSKHNSCPQHYYIYYTGNTVMLATIIKIHYVPQRASVSHCCEVGGTVVLLLCRGFCSHVFSHAVAERLDRP